MTDPSPAKVLVVDDNIAVHADFAKILTRDRACSASRCLIDAGHSPRTKSSRWWHRSRHLDGTGGACSPTPSTRASSEWVELSRICLMISGYR
jgi:hypothetical protein